MSDTDPDMSTSEQEHREAYRSLSARVWAVIVVAGGFVITGAITGIRDHDRLDALEARVAEHSASFNATTPVIGDVRSDLRVIRVELQQLSTTTTDVQQRVTRIEDSGRRSRQ